MADHDRPGPGQPTRVPVSTPAPRWSLAAGLLVTVVATALLLAGSVAVPPWDGVYLFRDFVTVPNPVLGANTLGGDGAPRAVPLDAVVALLSAVLPASLVGRLLLVTPLLLVGSGMTVLLRRFGPVATSVGAALAIANPYVAERLLLGQSPSLMGYAVIPWLVVVVRSDRPLRARVLLVLVAALPAALTPVGAVMAGITILVTARFARPVTGAHTDSRHQALGVLALLAPIALLSLPWVIAGLAHPSAGASPDGASAFAVRSDGPLGLIGSVATLGGVWAAGAVPDSRGSVVVVLLQLFIVVTALVSGALLVRSLPGRAQPDRAQPTSAQLASAAERALPPRTAPRPGRGSLGLACTAYVGSVVAVLLLAGPLLPVWRAAQQVPGVALLRDTHRLLGWATLGVAVLGAVGLAVAADRMRGSRLVTAAVAVAAVSLAVLTVPDVPGRLARDVSPVALPAEWEQVVGVINDGQVGRVLLLPWQPFRQVDWVGPVQFLDPFPRALEPEVVHARDLLVRRDGVEWHVGGEDPGLAAGVVGPHGALDVPTLREEGITHVLVWLGTPGEVPGVGDDVPLVHRGRHWTVLELP